MAATQCNNLTKKNSSGPLKRGLDEKHPTKSTRKYIRTVDRVLFVRFGTHSWASDCYYSPPILGLDRL